MNAEEILTSYGEHFINNNMFESGLRSVLWAVLKCLNNIGSGCANLLDKAYSILTFNVGNSDELKAILDPFSSGAFIVSLMVLVLVLIGVFMILGNRNLSGTKIIQNILLGVLIFAVMPLIINTFNNVFTGTDMSMDISLASSFDANTYDIQYMFTTNGDEPAEEINGFSSEEGAWIDTINVCEVIRGSKVTNDIDDVFSKVYRDGEVTTGGNGEILGVYLEPFATDYYYRYHVDMIPIFITSIATILVMIFTFFKVARLAYEMLWNQLFVKILSVTDIVSGTKIKESVKAIGGIYVVLLYIPLSIKVFCAFQNWLFLKTNGEDALYNTFEASLLLIAVAMAVIDGPNLIEKIFGVDAGIKSGFHTAMGIAAAGRTAMGVMSHGVKGVKGAYNLGKDITGTSGPMDKLRALRNTKLNNWAWNESGDGKKNNVGSGAVDRVSTPYSEKGRRTANEGTSTGSVGRQSGDKNKQSDPQANATNTAATGKNKTVNSQADKQEKGNVAENKGRNISENPADVKGHDGKEKDLQPEKANGAVSRPTSATEVKEPGTDNGTPDNNEKERNLGNANIGADAAPTEEKVSTEEAERSDPTIPTNMGVTAKKGVADAPKKQALEKADSLNHMATPQKKSSAETTNIVTAPATPLREHKDGVSAPSSAQRANSATAPTISSAAPVPKSSAAPVSKETRKAPAGSVGDTVSQPTPTPKNTQAGRRASTDKGTAAKKAKRKTDLH